MGGAQFRGKNNGALSFALWSWNCAREFLIRVLPVVVGPSQCYVEAEMESEFSKLFIARREFTLDSNIYNSVFNYMNY